MSRPKDSCVHHWICGDASGGIVGAACKKCGVERTFSAGNNFDFNQRLSVVMPDLITERQRTLLNGKGWNSYEDHQMADEVVS